MKNGNKTIYLHKEPLKFVVMKKFIALLFAFVLMMACGTSRYGSTELYYIAEGYGESNVSKDIAYDKAYHNALSKVSRKFSVKNENEDTRIYASTNTGSGKGLENLSYGETTKTNSHMSAHDIKVHRVRYRKNGNTKECHIVLWIPKENVE